MKHQFNGIDIQTPTSFSWDLKDINSGENGTLIDGSYHVDIIAQKRTLSYKWTDPAPTEVATILQLTNQAATLTIRYPDALTGAFRTATFRTLKRSAPFRELRVGALMYSELSLDFEEV